MPITLSSVTTQVLLNALNRTSAAQNITLRRLATGKRLNSAADDAAGLIAAQRLSRQSVDISAALTSGQRADAFAGAAGDGLKQVGELLTEIRGLAVAAANSAGLSQSELAAKQAQIDSAVESIDRIIAGATFNDQRLLDGTQAIRTSLDGTATTDLADVRVFSRRSGSASEALAVNVVSTARVASAVIAMPGVVSAASISIVGKLGTATISINAGQALSSILARVVQSAGETGVSARVSGAAIIGVSREYGTEAFVSVTRISGDADFQSVARVSGTNAVVSVGGQTVTADGLVASFGMNGISGQLSLTAAGNVVGNAGTLTINGGGATFQLGTSSHGQTTIGLQAVGSANLGGADVGYLSQLKSGGSASLTANATNALAIATRAAAQVSNLQARLGGFQQYSVQSTLNTLSNEQENIESARSLLEDIDYVEESSRLARQKILIQSSMQLLGIVNQQAESILSLF